MADKKIRLTTNARVRGVLRSPGEGVIAAPAGEADRLVADKKAVLHKEPAPAKSKATPGSKRRRAPARAATPPAKPATESTPAKAPPSESGEA